MRMQIFVNTSQPAPASAIGRRPRRKPKPPSATQNNQQKQQHRVALAAIPHKHNQQQKQRGVHSPPTIYHNMRQNSLLFVNFFNLSYEHVQTC